jgi:hypothetical protein
MRKPWFDIANWEVSCISFLLGTGIYTIDIYIYIMGLQMRAMDMGQIVTFHLQDLAMVPSW